ncbi:MAG: hypothetical protein N2439_07215, partial [Anaerolineae bacterium]|nr:hypothetical protein [Anaerolineae bacterium]
MHERNDARDGRLRAWSASALALAAGVVVSGCGLSSLTSGIGGGWFGGGAAPKSSPAVTNENLLIAAKADGPQGAAGSGADVAPGCPRVTIVSRDKDVTIYEAGRVGDALGVVHRGEITKTARECLIEGGRVTIKYGFSGRVLLGPRGKTQTVQLPVTVYVT